MTNQIYSRTFGGVPENVIQLGSAMFSRAITLPSTWSKVRVAFRGHMISIGAIMQNSPQLWVGLGSGTGSNIGDRLTNHFVGIGSKGASALYTAYSYQFEAWATTKVGSTVSWSAARTGYFMIGNNQTSAQRSFWFIDFTKGSPNYAINVFGRNVSTTLDTSAATMLSKILTDSPSLTGYAAGASQNMAVDEATNGTLNCVQIYWDQPNFFEICDLAVCVLA